MFVTSLQNGIVKQGSHQNDLWRATGDIAAGDMQCYIAHIITPVNSIYLIVCEHVVVTARGFCGKGEVLKERLTVFVCAHFILVILSASLFLSYSSPFKYSGMESS
jgi:hypothetical protein